MQRRPFLAKCSNWWAPMMQVNTQNTAKTNARGRVHQVQCLKEKCRQTFFAQRGSHLDQPSNTNGH